MALADIADLGNGLARQHGPGGIAWRVEQKGAGFRRDGAFEIGGLEMEAIVGIDAHRNGDAACRGDDAFVSGVVGIGHQHFVAQFNGCLQGHEQGGLRAGEEDELLGADGAAGAFGILRREAVEEFGFAAAGGVFIAAGAHLGVHHIHD